MPANRRWDARRDLAEPAIVNALEAAGVRVWRELPCDLLTHYRGRWLPLEVKTPTGTGKRRKRSDQAEQDEFIATTGTPVVMTPEQALAVVGAIQEGA